MEVAYRDHRDLQFLGLEGTPAAAASGTGAQLFTHPTHFWVTHSNDIGADAIGKFQLHYHRVPFSFVSVLWQVGVLLLLFPNRNS